MLLAYVDRQNYLFVELLLAEGARVLRFVMASQQMLYCLEQLTIHSWVDCLISLRR